MIRGGCRSFCSSAQFVSSVAAASNATTAAGRRGAIGGPPRVGVGPDRDPVRTLDDRHLGEILVRSWLFKWGRWAYLVNFVVSADLANEAGADFDAIQDSLQFGA